MYGDNAGWYSLLEQASNRTLSTQEVLSLSVHRQRIDGDSRWAMPMAMAYWIEGRYSEALATLLEPSFVRC